MGSDLAKTERKFDNEVVKTVETLRERCDWIKQEDLPLARAFCEIELLAREAYELVRLDGLMVNGRAHPLLGEIAKFRKLQLGLASQLCLSPRARVDFFVALKSLNRGTNDIDNAAVPETEVTNGN